MGWAGACLAPGCQGWGRFVWTLQPSYSPPLPRERPAGPPGAQVVPAPQAADTWLPLRCAEAVCDRVCRLHTCHAGEIPVSSSWRLWLLSTPQPPQFPKGKAVRSITEALSSFLPAVAMLSLVFPDAGCVLGADWVQKLRVAKQPWPLSPPRDPALPHRPKCLCEAPRRLLLHQI